MAVKIFVICDKKVDVPTSGIIHAIQTDRTDGINIADMEHYYDLRAQYWIWRNGCFADDDQIGFFHYRRYLDLNSDVVEPNSGVKPTPYRILKRPPDIADECAIKAKIQDYDVIAPVWEYTSVSVRDRFRHSPRHRGSDMDTLYQILKEKYPQFLDAADAYLNGKGEYYCNIYIMRWSAFKEYGQWLFDILKEVDSKSDAGTPSSGGFLGERLFGIYYTWLCAQGKVKCGELPRVHFSIYDDETHNFKKERIINMLLPPGSRRRGIIRRIKYSLEDACL